MQDTRTNSLKEKFTTIWEPRRAACVCVCTYSMRVISIDRRRWFGPTVCNFFFFLFQVCVEWFCCFFAFRFDTIFFSADEEHSLSRVRVSHSLSQTREAGVVDAWRKKIRTRHGFFHPTRPSLSAIFFLSFLYVSSASFSFFCAFRNQQEKRVGRKSREEIA